MSRTKLFAFHIEIKISTFSTHLRETGNIMLYIRYINILAPMIWLKDLEFEPQHEHMVGIIGR